MREPRTLFEILSKASAPMFRVRDTETCKDYLAISVYSWGDNGNNASMYMYACDDDRYVYKDARLKKYALLSTVKEVEQMKRMRDEFVIRAIEASYRAGRAKKC